MKRAATLALLLVGALGFHGQATAHHSYAATYFADQTTEIRGEIVQFMFRNPHSILQVMVRATDGTSSRWACEWVGTLMLGNSRVTRYTLKPGDQVIITGSPGRNPEDHRLLVRTIERPADGWKWSMNPK